jgi:23S rRNA (cytosine1962-C5)-methyltransferase
MNPRIILKPGKEKPVLNHHPWIFSGAIARADGASDGSTIDICDSNGKFLARGYYNSRSQIAARIWTWRDEAVDSAFLRARLVRAAAARGARGAHRLVNAESDFIPGLVVDRYADFIIVQFLTRGVEARKTEIVGLLADAFQPHGIYERSDADVREKEGLTTSLGVLDGAEPPDRLEISENGLAFWVDVKRGHKTGFYLDQGENRKRVSELLAQELGRGNSEARELLNVFSYTGGFGVYACAADPAVRVTNLDSSRDALELARENMQLNHCEARGEFTEGDAFQVLRKYRDQGR